MPADISDDGEYREPPEEVDLRPWYRRGLQCGWCDEWVCGTTSKGVHIRLLWHQWWNHRSRIWEEY